MTAQSLKKMILSQKFKEPAFFCVQPGRGRKRVNSMVVKEVATTEQEEPSGGWQPCCAQGFTRIPERFSARFIKFCEISCNAIHTKLAMRRSIFLLTCQQERRLF
ncbi:hypothetical protein TNCV_429311 [Trichonephila clavipes]|nr:hypothetical protein TNCV_429311 [Trichonephila clavipes]